MTTFTVEGGGALRGRLRMPGDKSISHRALLVAARAHGTSCVRGLSDGDDVARTLAAVRALGAEVTGERVTGGRLREPESVVDAGNSGTTMRLLAGFCAAFPWLTVISGDASLSARPMERVTAPLREMGAWVDGRQDGAHAPLVVRGGGLRGIDYTLPVASAQVKSAILLAGLGAEGATTVHERVRSRAHTEELLAQAGGTVAVAPDGLSVTVQPSELSPIEIDVPGDPSQAAFWMVAATITPGSEITVEDVYVGPARTGFVDVLRRMGADIGVERTGEQRATLTARSASLRATEIDGDEISGLDEIPVLAVAAAVAEGTTVVRNASDLRMKESDRIATTAAALEALGVRIEPTADGLVITGPVRLRGATVDSHGDHRVAMAMAVAGCAAEGVTTVTGWNAVGISYPRFAEDLASCR